MAKKIFTIEIECFQANRNKEGTQAIFIKNIQQTDKGPATNTYINFNIPVQDLATKLEPGKQYTISIEE